jgi:hypothetical protein
MSFVPGADLSEAFCRECVRPLLGDLPHAAAFLGWGSDVLGYDTERSVDHGWGPRCQVFLPSASEATAVQERLDLLLPGDFGGYPVRFGWDGAEAGMHVAVTTWPLWLTGQLGIDPTAGVTTADWLVTPQQRLLGVVEGRVFADPAGELAAVRSTLAWYPDQVWRWIVACQWHRISQEEAFVSRTAEVGDHVGSAVIAARLVRDVMRLALLLGRRYAPYQKWLGTAFLRLPHDDGLPEALAATVQAVDGQRREAALGDAYRLVALRHNNSGLTEPLSVDLGDYHGRPARVLMADRFSVACLATVSDPVLLRLPLIGSIDQVVDSTDALDEPAQFRRLTVLYQG